MRISHNRPPNHSLRIDERPLSARHLVAESVELECKIF